MADGLYRLSWAPDAGGAAEDPNATPTWGDWGSALLKVGTPEALASATSLVRAGAENQLNADKAAGDERSPTLHAVAGMSKVLGDVLMDYAGDSEKELSPAMKKDLAAAVTSEHFLEHPVRSLAAQSIRTAPTVGMAAAAGLVTPAGPWGAVIMAGLTSGGLEAGQTVQQFYQITDDMDDKTLRQNSKYYDGLRAQGMDEQTAREDFNEKFRGLAPLYVAALGAVTGIAGPAGQFVRGLKGVGHTGGILSRIGKASTEGFLAEGAQEGQQNYVQQKAQIREGFQKNFDERQLFDNTAMGALIGGALGAPAGVFHGAEHGPTPEPTPEPTPTPTGEDNQGAPPPAGGGVPVVESQPPTGATPSTELPVTPKVTPTPAEAQPTVPTSGGNAAPVSKPAGAGTTVDDTRYKQKWRTRRKYRTGEQSTYSVTPGAPDDAQALALASSAQPGPITSTGRMDVGPVSYPQAQPQTQAIPETSVNFGPEPQGYLEQAAQARATRPQTVPTQPEAVPTTPTTAPGSPVAAGTMGFGTEATPQEAPASEAPLGPTDTAIQQGNQGVATAKERKHRGRRVLADTTKKPTSAPVEQLFAASHAEAKAGNAVVEKAKKKAAAAKKKGHGDQQRAATKQAKEQAADLVFRANEHQPSPAENDYGHPNPAKRVPAQRKVLERAKNIVSRFEALSGLTVNKDLQRLKKTTGEPMPPGVVLVRVAQDLLNRTAKNDGQPTAAAISAYLADEYELRSGDENAVDNILNRRRVEGDAAKKGGTKRLETVAAPAEVAPAEEASKEENVVEEAGVDDPLEAPKVETDEEGAPAPKPDEDEPQADKRGAPEGSRASAADDAQDVAPKISKYYRPHDLEGETVQRVVRDKKGRERTEEVAKAASGEKLTPEEKARLIDEMNAKLGVTPKVTPQSDANTTITDEGSKRAYDEVMRELGWAEVEGTPRTAEETFNPDKETRAAFIHRMAYSLSTFQQAMTEELKDFVAHTTGPERVILQAFARRIMGLVSDVRVYVVPDDAYYQIKERGSGAFYDPNQDFIAIPQSTWISGVSARALLHEGVHAAFLRVTQHLPHVRGMVLRIAQELRKRSLGTEYEFHNVDEFIAEANSNPATIQALMNTRASPGLAMIVAQNRKLPINKRIRTLWDALVDVVANTLGFTGARNYSLLDAMMQASAELEFGVRELGRLPTVTKELMDSNSAKDASVENSPWNEKQARFSRISAPAPNLDILTARKEAGYHGSAFLDWAKRNVVKFMDLNGIRRAMTNTIFHDPVQRLTFAINKQSPERQAFRQKFDELAQQFADYAKKKYVEAQEFADLALTATNLNVRILDGHTAATILDAQENSHLKGRALTGVQARKQAGALQERYNKLSPEGKKLFQEMSNLYREAHNTIVSSSVRAILGQKELANLTDAEREDLIQRTLGNQLTDDDEKLLGKQLFNLLHKEAGFKAVKGTYFPRMRYGDYVVIGKDKLTDLMGGTQTSDNSVLFRDKSMAAARRKAETFLENTPFHEINTKHVYIDGNTGERVTLDQSKSLNNVEHGYEVTVQTRGVHMFESAAEAHKFAAENPEQYDEISGVEDRLGPQYQAHVLTGTQYATMISSINQNEKLSEGQKEMLRTAISHAAARMLRGNRITSRRLKSKKVTGASTDFARNLLNYGDAGARHLAVARAAPVIRDALNQMKEALNGYSGKDKNLYVQVYNELRARVDQGTIEPNEAGKLMKDLMTVSFFTRLASPAYSLINGMQVIMISAPVLGGRYGNLRAYRELMKGYADMGFSQALIGGVMNTAKAAKQWNRAGIKTDNLLENVLKKIDKQADGAALRSMIERLMELNAISTTAGFETSEAIAHGRGQWGHTLAKTDRIVRQLPQAIEIINRTVTAVAAYRLRRAEGFNHEQATMFALDTVQQTQGDYTSSNAPRFFNNQYLRPATQFKKYAHLYTMLLGNMVHDAFAGATPEEKRIAQKQLLSVIATQIAFAGMLSLPGLELVKAGFMVTAALGLTGGWDDQEEKMRKLAEESFGKDWGQMVTSGVITRAAGIDVSQRLSAADLWIFGEPKKYDAEGIAAWMMNTAAGSAGTMLLDAREGLTLAQQGEWAKGFGKMIPFKALADAVKASEAEKAKGMAEFGLNAFGLRSARQAEIGRAKVNTAKRTQYREDTYKKLSHDYINAYTKGDKMKLKKKIDDWNKTVPRHYQVYTKSLDKIPRNR